SFFSDRRRQGTFAAAALLAAGSLTALFAQAGKPATASPAPAAPAAAGRGLELGDMDPTAKACQDFFQYADGGWTKKNAIPPEYPSWGTFSELAERNRVAMRKILDRLAKEKSAAGSEEQKIGDFYASCMDEA